MAHQKTRSGMLFRNLIEINSFHGAKSPFFAENIFKPSRRAILWVSQILDFRQILESRLYMGLPVSYYVNKDFYDGEHTKRRAAACYLEIRNKSIHSTERKVHFSTRTFSKPAGGQFSGFHKSWIFDKSWNPGFIWDFPCFITLIRIFMTVSTPKDAQRHVI